MLRSAEKSPCYGICLHAASRLQDGGGLGNFILWQVLAWGKWPAGRATGPGTISLSAVRRNSQERHPQWP